MALCEVSLKEEIKITLKGNNIRRLEKLLQRNDPRKRKSSWNWKNIAENWIKYLEAQMEELSHEEENLKEIEMVSAKQKVYIYIYGGCILLLVKGE